MPFKEGQQEHLEPDKFEEFSYACELLQLEKNISPRLFLEIVTGTNVNEVENKEKAKHLLRIQAILSIDQAMYDLLKKTKNSETIKKYINKRLKDVNFKER